MAIEKDQLALKLEEGKQVVTYYLESVLNLSLDSSTVQEPQQELLKVSTLIHSHVTKIGIVFKPVIKETTYNACSEEITTLIKTVSLLASLMRQFQKSEDKYSKLYVFELLQQFKMLAQCINALLGELIHVLDLTDDNESGERLVDVGRIWECCDVMKQLSSSGSSGVLNSKLVESNKLVIDGIDELEEWIKNPHMEEENDPFDFSDVEDDAATLDKSDDQQSDKLEVDLNLIEFSKKWLMKIRLIKLLMSTLNKSIPGPTISTKFGTTIDLLNERRLKLNEYIDELIGSIIWDSDLDAANDATTELIKCVNSVIQLVSKLNDNNENKTKWLLTWKSKFLEDIK